MSRRLFDLLMAIVALIPFYGVYVAHYSRAEQASGFIQYDMPYYVANGREIFERGNGFAGPNPYIPNPEAPAIYFHWLTWFIGFAVTGLKLDPETVFLSIGLAGGIAGSYLTLQLVRHLLEKNGPVIPIFLLSMWGGGILSLCHILSNVVNGLPLFDSPLAFDPGRGWWFLTWGRNFLFPTEAVYHAFVVAIWLSVLKRREWLAVLLVCLLAATHPFSGIQHLLILGSWNLVQLIVSLNQKSADTELQEHRSWKKPLFRGFTLTAALTLFMGYYFVFLEQFPSHSELRKTWTLHWIVPASIVVMAYGPVFLIALRNMQGQWKLFVPERFFFIVAFAVSFALIQHDRFIEPHQPLHFTRGYVWMPLFLLGTPILSRWIQHLSKERSHFQRRIFLSFFILIASLDNITFLVSTSFNNHTELLLAQSAREAFDWMDDNELNGILLSPDANLSYLSATFTPVRPYYGHVFNTPQYSDRLQQVKDWKETGQHGDWFGDIDYILLRKGEDSFESTEEAAEKIYSNDDYTLFKVK